VTDVSATGGSPELSACLTAVLKRLQFPPSSGGKIVVDYPFNFSRP
jgi:hypothetical protein